MGDARMRWQWLMLALGLVLADAAEDGRPQDITFVAGKAETRRVFAEAGGNA